MSSVKSLSKQLSQHKGKIGPHGQSGEEEDVGPPFLAENLADECICSVQLHP